MTTITLIRTVDVRVALAAGVSTVMTINTIVGESRVIDSGWQPGANGMANITFFGCTDVINILTGCNRTVVTT